MKLISRHKELLHLTEKLLIHIDCSRDIITKEYNWKEEIMVIILHMEKTYDRLKRI